MKARTHIDGKTLDWLCEWNNPPVRYLTLKNFAGKTERALKKESARINLYSIIKAILKQQKTFWGKDKNLYRKYKGGYWNLIFLGDLFADGRDRIIRDGVEFILADGLWHKRIDEYSTTWICLSSNITRAIANLGYAEDPRVQTHTENIAKAIVQHDGIVCTVMDYSFLPQCHMALPKVLMALGSYTGKKRIVKQAIKITSEKLLERDIFRYIPESQEKWNENYERLSVKLEAKRSESKAGKTLKAELAAIRPMILKQNRSFKPKPGWLKFGYPLHYNSDILEAMRSLIDVGIKYDKRMDDALDVIEENRLPDGTWKLGFSLNGKMWIDIEKRGQPSKWITYHALRVLKTYGRVKL
ncbi:MAG: hypothetical protein V3W18_10630 [candidate division Zixibacteria bacterium]